VFVNPFHGADDPQAHPHAHRETVADSEDH
jgi:hypothetical protein